MNDGLTRQHKLNQRIARFITRRELFQSTLGTLSGLLLGSAARRATVTAQGDCDSTQILCGESCVDPNWDNTHCGWCDQPCSADQTCRYGVCEQLGGCESWETDCEGYCTDILWDYSHCGACFASCVADQTCNNGVCEGGTSCQDGQTDCGGYCTDVNWDSSHCGWCFNGCAYGQTCEYGVCVGSGDCEDWQTNCNGTCTDVSADSWNCGWCNNVCPEGALCQGGTCVTEGSECETWQIECDGYCANPDWDNEHCGGCNVVCAAGSSCQNGSCVFCSDTGSPDYCPPIGPGLGHCTDLTADASNCGFCGNVCASGSYCQGGECDTVATPGSWGTPCDDDTDCLQALYCSHGRCQNCKHPETFCYQAMMRIALPGDLPSIQESPDLCHDLNSDSAHCGACFHRCTQGRQCIDGQCVFASQCEPGRSRCGNACVDLQTHPLNCGSCGNTCPTDGMGVCNGGVCDCLVNRYWPCGDVCAELSSDAEHCGACFNTCPGGICINRVCAGDPPDAESGLCPVGQQLCGDVCCLAAGCCEGTCRSIRSDVQHCGGCDTSCDEDEVCRAGECMAPESDETPSGLTLLSFQSSGYAVEKNCYWLSLQLRNDGAERAKGSLQITETPTYLNTDDAGQEREVQSPIEAGFGGDQRDFCESPLFGDKVRSIQSLESTVELDPGESTLLGIGLAHNWDWIEPANDVADVVSLLLSALPADLAVSGSVSKSLVRICQQILGGAMSVDGVVDLAITGVSASPLARYDYDLALTGIRLGDKATAATTMLVEVSNWKRAYYRGSFTVTLTSIFTGLAATLLASPLPVVGTVIGLGSGIVLGLAGTLSGISLYRMAFDPDPDYTATIQPEPIDQSWLVDVPEGEPRDCAAASLTALSLLAAAEQATIRAAAARDASDDVWYARQLAAAKRFVVEAFELEERAVSCLQDVALDGASDGSFTPALRQLWESAGLDPAMVNEIESASVELAPVASAALQKNPALLASIVGDHPLTGGKQLLSEIDVMFKARFSDSQGSWIGLNDTTDWVVSAGELNILGSNPESATIVAASFALGNHTHYAIETEIRVGEPIDCRSESTAGIVIRKTDDHSALQLSIDPCRHTLRLNNDEVTFDPRADWITMRVEVRDNHLMVIVNDLVLLDAEHDPSLAGGLAGLFAAGVGLSSRRFEIIAIGDEPDDSNLGVAPQAVETAPDLQPEDSNGILLVRLFDCPNVEPSLTSCPPRTEPTEVRLSTGDGEPVLSASTDQQGSVEFANLSAGAYSIDMVDRSWCFAEASAVDSNGRIIVTADAATEVRLFICEK